ncbi:MAG: hypothetical protein HRU70_00355 [Phycisphaeraceae bacterium]|nr:MAG: hypothetical protein HRU70_00355 [Phycisphaeraceae bacterium]
MKKFAILLAGAAMFVAGCQSKTDGAAAGAVSGEKCCADKAACTDKAAPGMVEGKKDCASGCATKKAACTDKPAAGMVAGEAKSCATPCSDKAKSSCTGQN